VQSTVSGIFSVALFSNLAARSFSRALCSMVPGLSSNLAASCYLGYLFRIFIISNISDLSILQLVNPKTRA